MPNLNRLRQGDILHLKNGESYTVDDCWISGNVIQMVMIEKKDTIFAFNILGRSLDPEGSDVAVLQEVPQPDDEKTYYLPKIEVSDLPVLHINGEDKIIYQLFDLDGLEIKEPQTLVAKYKPVITAKLMKKKGRDLEMLKEEKIICESKEDCEERLKKIDEQLQTEKANLSLSELVESASGKSN